MKELMERIQRESKNKDRYVISIDGPAASGKSTLAKELKRQLNAVVFHIDDYFLPPEMKTPERLSVPGGNVYHERFKEEILSHLNEETITYNKFNCSSLEHETMTKKIVTKYIVVEGVYSQQKTLREFYDLNLFTEVDRKTQLERLEERNPKLLGHFINEWLPLEEFYFEKANTKVKADYIIDTGNSL